MSMFIKSLEIEVWESVVLGWTAPTKIKNGETMAKPESEWKCEERKAASRNYTTLQAIQCCMDDKTFSLIGSLEFSKEAWNIL